MTSNILFGCVIHIKIGLQFGKNYPVNYSVFSKLSKGFKLFTTSIFSMNKYYPNVFHYQGFKCCADCAFCPKCITCTLLCRNGVFSLNWAELAPKCLVTNDRRLMLKSRGEKILQDVFFSSLCFQ